jgi:unspecific monooxygenase
MATMLKRRVLAATGRAARHVPVDQAQLFAFLASPSVRADPWALYRRLHRRGAVRSGPMGSWMVGSHAGVSHVLRVASTSVVESLATGYPPPGTSPFSTLINRTLLFTDPPDHARLRRLVSRAFTPATMARLEPSVTELVDASVQRLRPAGEADLLAELAFPVPVAVICELLGVPESERSRFAGWARGLAPRLDIDLFRDPEKERRGDEAAIALEGFLRELVDDRSRRRPDGLLAALVAVEEEGDRLSRDEVVALCALLLVAGFETTANLVGNGLLALLREPEQLARLRDGEVDPALAVEELLRYAGPVQFAQRVLLEDLELDGEVIPARTLVALLIGAANRDPAVFAEPDRLDVGRQPNPHLAFSSGIHHCLGAALARVEARVMLLAVLRGLPGLRLAAAPRWRDTFVLRGLQGLPVAWDAG